MSPNIIILINTLCLYYKLKLVVMNMKIFLLTVVLLATITLKNSAQGTPDINKKIIEYVNSVMGKKVDRGECWDLVAKAMNYSEAKWKAPSNFGTIVNYEKEEIFEGDIIFFEKVTIKFENAIQNYPHHYAVIYKVLEKGKYQIAEQNNNGVKKVIISELNLNYKTKGTVKIYRPGLK